MLKLTLLIILPLVSQIQCFGIGPFRTNECEQISDPNICAILYEEIKCNSGEVVMKPGQNVTFSTNAFRGDVDLVDIIGNDDKKNDIESVVVNAGCTLEVFDVSRNTPIFRA